MFIINNEILSKQNLPEHWAWFENKVKELRDKKRFYTFSSFKFHRYEKDENGKKIRMKRYKLVPTLSTFENKEMGETQTWVYVPSANAIRNENGLVRVLNPKPFMISEATIYDVQKDAEIVFFLLYVSEALVSKKIFMIDLEEENIRKANEAAIAAEAQYLIFSQQSPIHENTIGNDSVFRHLGMAYGITGADSMHIAELKNSLWNRLVSANKSKKHGIMNFESFIKDCYNSTDAEYRSTILLAVQRGIIHFDKGAWQLKIRGEFDEPILRVSSNNESKKRDVLINYLMQNKEYMEIVREALDSSSKRMAPVEANPQTQENDMKRNDMVKVLMDHGWSFKDLMPKKNPELKKMIDEKRNPVVT